MGSPTVSTIKRLFAVSQNRCAFPKCNQPLVESASGKVVGRVCHIKAARPGGPRYDDAQDEKARHAFSNLILMCPVHHDVIDADPTAYTVERLESMKSDHESQEVIVGGLPQEAAEQFIANIAHNTISNGSVVYSVNQSGGQIAHSIINNGPQPRSLSESAANILVLRLREMRPERYEVETIAGDVEASRLAHQTDNMLSHTGWTGIGFATSVFPQHITGVEVSYPKESEGIRLLSQFLRSAQLQPSLRLLPALDRIHVLVGSQI